MAGSQSSSSQGMFSGINVTPMVDIMLVLLVIFMVTARLIVSQTVPLDLPRATTGGEQQIVFAVALDASGAITVDSRPIASDQELGRLAEAARQKDPELRAVIQADSAVPHGRVVRLMDLLKQARISKIAFGVVPEVTQSQKK